jgi:arginine decarboxylase
MAAGADGAVTSAHKVLSSLSQSSLLNVRAGLVDPARVAAAVRMTQTTSPLPLLASLDACRQQLAADGQALLGQAPAPVWRPGPVPEQAMSPREAYFSPSRRVRLQDAAGEVAAELVVPYPPGIPALAPGEVIDPEVVDHLLSCRRAQVHICGPDDPTLDRVAVVDGA